MSRHVAPVRLAAFARGQLQGKRAAEVKLHLEACAVCRSSLSRIETAQDAMRLAADAPVPEPSAAADARGEATVRWTRLPAAPRVAPWVWGTVGLGLAAAGVVAYLNRAPAPQLAVKTPPPAAVKVQPVAESIEATLTLLGGKVDLTRSFHTSALTATDHLRGADQLVTHGDSRVAAQWSDGSGFLLLADSQLGLEQLDRHTQKLHILRGQVDVRVGPHQPGEVLRVQSNAHVVTVRGTWFTVAASGERTTVEVFEGVVEVSELDGSSSTLLHAPARAVFGRGGRVSSGAIDAHEMAQLKQRAELNLMSMVDLPSSGTFSVATDPAGSVAVDGVEVGLSPLSVRRPLGKHYVEVSRPKYKPLQKWITVGLEPGELRVALVRTPEAPQDGNEPVAIEEMVKQRGRQIRSCYERSLKRDPTLTGTVSLLLRVGGAGQVTQAHVEPTSTLSDPQVSACLEHEAVSWRFTTGRNATVVYPLVFRPY
jgi:hypothetical protein